MRVYVCVCSRVCEREKEAEREKKTEIRKTGRRKPHAKTGKEF